jgi:hypothetical protein
LEVLKLEVGSWKLEVGSWKLEVGSWKLEVGSWKLEVGSWSRKEPTPGVFRMNVKEKELHEKDVGSC